MRQNLPEIAMWDDADDLPSMFFAVLAYWTVGIRGELGEWVISSCLIHRDANVALSAVLPALGQSFFVRRRNAPRFTTTGQTGLERKGPRKGGERLVLAGCASDLLEPLGRAVSFFRFHIVGIFRGQAGQ
jgi:hypothetical protein